MLSTPLCALLGIEHPVLNAPMSGTATAELAAAVSLAGGFGMLGGSSAGGADWLRAQIRAARSGVDVVIAQGTEAGGHTGQAGTLALLPAVVDAVGDIPVVAAGGIADGRGLAAVLLLGASGGWLGTRFVASAEWGGAAQDQQAVLAAGADDTVRTTVYDQVRGAPFPEGIADRVLRNAFTSAWEGRTGDIAARQAELRRELEEAAEQGDPTVVDISAGVAVGLISSLEPAGAIVQRIVEETERVLRERVALLLREAPHR